MTIILLVERERAKWHANPSSLFIIIIISTMLLFDVGNNGWKDIEEGKACT